MRQQMLRVLSVCALVLGMAGVSFGQSTWSGGTDSDWNEAGNWDVLPTTGDSLIFNSFAGDQPTNNDFVGFSVNLLSFGTSMPDGGVTLGGNAFTLTGGLTNTNTTSNRPVTIENNIEIGAAQDWVITNNANTITLIEGNLTGIDDIRIQARDLGTTMSVSTVSNLIFSGDNSGYTGNINIRQTGSDQRSSMTLANPDAMTGGNIRLSQRSTLGLVANASAYTFGIGTGAVQVDMGPSETGLLAIGGAVTWDPGNGGGYNWANIASNRIGIKENTTSGENHSVIMGTSGQTLTFNGAAKTIQAQGNLDMQFTLSDDGTARNLTKSGGGVMLLRGGTFGGTANGTTTVSGGGIDLTNMNQIANGNLNLSGGAYIFNSLGWSDFVADRASYGTGADQWQVGSGGGFAARGSDVTIDTTGTTTTTFDRSFALGASLRDADRNLYADAGVRITQDIDLSSADNRTWIARGANQEGANWTITNVVNEIAGQISGGDAARTLSLLGSGTNNSSAGGTIQFSNVNNDFRATIQINGTNGGGIVAVFTDDLAFGHADNLVRIVDAGSGPDGLLMFRDLSGAGKEFAKGFEVAASDASSASSGFGSYSGQVDYVGTATYTGTQGGGVVQVREGTLTLGTDDTAAVLQNNRTGSGGTLLSLRKGMEGTLVLNNVDYTGNFKWILNGGTLVTTQAPTVTNIAGQLRSDGSQFAINDILNANNSTNAGVTWHVANESQTYTGLAGGGFGGGVNLNVDTDLTLRLDLGSNLLTSAEIGPNTTGLSWGLSKVGEGTWEYRTTNTATNSPGRNDGYVRVAEGTFDQMGGMGRTAIWVDGGTYLAGNVSQFTGGNRFHITGGKIGISTDAVSNVQRSTTFDGTNSLFNLGGVGTLTLASRDNLDLIFGMTFPTINAGETLLIERDGSGTGAVQINSGLTVDGTLGGSGTVRAGASGTGDVTINGILDPGSSPGTLTIEGNLIVGSDAVMNFEVGSASDLMVVLGNLTVADGFTVNIIDYDSSFVSGTDITLFSGYSDFDGDFNQWEINLPSGWSYEFVVDDSGNIILTNVDVIPEPTTAALLGLAALALLRRRRAA